MNVAFCLWLWFRSLFHKDRIELMIQECFMPFSKASWRQNVIAAAHRLMTLVVLRAAKHAWIALPDYKKRLRPYTLGRRLGFTWLPVPSNVAVIDDQLAVAEIRKRLAPRGFLMGHFGTFGRSITEMLEHILPAVLRGVDSSLVLLGSGSKEFRERLISLCPDCKDRIHASGYLKDAELSGYLSACDVMIQPYPDGMTARRGSALAPLAHGRPVITNATACTESLWNEEGSVMLAAATGAAFLEAVRQVQREPSEAKRLSEAARRTYLRYFEPAHMVSVIQGERS
jgi:glycosyltransferase involved in cell wall biosynthesis